MPFSPKQKVAVCVLFAAITLHAQQPPQPTVLFERHADTPAPTATPEAETAITDAERSAVTITAYDLDARIAPAASRLAMRARVTLRNDNATPLTHIALQISSTLHWESISLLAQPTRFTQHILETDTDHTGRESEAVITLATPLAPQASLTLDTFYSGTLTADATRLTRIGASPGEAAATDWDALAPDTIALRGFGNILWYPVASAPLFLGQGAQLFEAAGSQKRAAVSTLAHLHLLIDYAGDPPVAAYFCGRRAPLVALADDANAPTAVGTGLATADFPAQALGFRTLSLFLVNEPEQPVLAADHKPLPLVVATSQTTLQPALAANAEDATSLLTAWLGPKPLSTVALLDHPGQPFEDGPLLVAPVASMAAAGGVAALTYSLTHAWVQTGEPWIDEGLAQFFVLLQTERTAGRDAATAQLNTLLKPLTLAEPAPDPANPKQPMPIGQPLPVATSELYYRRKAAAVWTMLRALTSDAALQSALQTTLAAPPSNRTTSTEKALLFETLLEKAADKDLHWFFDDWVLHDRGLPDLVITNITPRELPAQTGKGGGGWLIAVTIRNEGAATTDVPLVVRSGSFSETQRVRIPGLGTTTARILVESPPSEILLNDGTTPEQRANTHIRAVTVRR